MAKQKPKPKPVRTNAEEIPSGGWRADEQPNEQNNFINMLPKPSGNKTIMFDFSSGDLVVKPVEEQTDKEVVCDQIYKDGFFFTPIYLQETYFIK